MSSRFISPFYDVGSGIKPPSGARLFFFEADGTTLKDTFSDQLSTPTANTNPVIANSNGVFGNIFITGQYKVTLQDKNGSQIFGLAFVEELVTGSEQLVNVLSRDTLDAAVIDTSLQAGLSINLKERTTGNGGGAMWDVVTAGSTPGVDLPNSFNIVICTGVPTLALVLRNPSESTPTMWGCAGDKIADDTLPLQAFFDYFKGVNAAQPNTTPNVNLDSGAVYLLTARVVAENFGINGNGAVLFTSGTTGILQTIGSNNIYEGVTLRYDTAQNEPTREAWELSDGVQQNAKNVFINCVTRNAYRGFNIHGGAGAAGGTAATSFIGCRADLSWDWGWYLDCSTGTTTLSMHSCQQFGRLTDGSTQIKGMFINNCAEVSLTGGTSMDQVSDGLALQIIGSKTVTIEQVTLESCEMTSSGSKMISINGADVTIGVVSAKVCLFDFGVGNEGYLVEVGSTTKSLTIDAIVTSNDQSGSGTLFHGRSGTGVPIKVNNTSIDLWQVNGLYSTFYNNGDTQGYSNNFNNTGAAGVERRQLINRSPTPGAATHWIDDGTDYQVGAVILGGEVTTATTAQFADISHAVNTSGKWLGKVLPDTTTGLTMMALGSTAAHQWRPSDNSGDITPV